MGVAKLEMWARFAGRHRRRRARKRAWSKVMLFGALVVSFCVSMKGVVALPVTQTEKTPATALRIAAERRSPSVDKSWIIYRVGMLERASFHEQHVHQEVLAALLMSHADQLPSASPCGLRVRFLDPFGDFAIEASHQNPGRRLACLRSAIDYLLRETINEFDFTATSKEGSYWTRMGFSSDTYAQQLALVKIYQKNSPLYQIHATWPSDLAGASFEAFELWLRRTREQKLITFGGKSELLDVLGLSIPDPMILRLAPSLQSPRVTAGTLFFDGERNEILALIMVRFNVRDQDSIDRQMAERLSCNFRGPTRLDAPFGSAISRVSCQLSDWYGEGWLSLSARKSDGASYQDYCRQAQQLVSDMLVAALVRGSREGSESLYILLPPACQTHQ